MRHSEDGEVQEAEGHDEDHYSFVEISADFCVEEELLHSFQDAILLPWKVIVGFALVAFLFFDMRDHAVNGVDFEDSEQALAVVLVSVVLDDHLLHQVEFCCRLESVHRSIHLCNVVQVFDSLLLLAVHEQPSR